MADPVTMAVVGGSVGALMNKKDPLKGALLGAVGGYGGGALMGAGGALGSTAGTATSGLMPGAAGAFGQAVPAIGANAVPAAGIFSVGDLGESRIIFFYVNLRPGSAGDFDLKGLLVS